MGIVDLKDVTKRYGSFLAVDSVSFSIEPGKIFGLLGPNGAGKTSTIRMLNLITLPDSGSINLFGEPQQTGHQNRIGYMPEERGLYRKLPVREQLEYLAALRGLDRKQSKQHIDYWLQRFEIQSWVKKKTGELSKGMQQKLQFIATMLHDPELLILDEPLSGLDPLNAELINEIILELKAKGKTIILSTHRMEQVEELCDDIALMNLGKVVVEGPLRKVKQQFGKRMIKLVFHGPDTFLSEVGRFNIRVADRQPNQIIFDILPGGSPSELLKFLANTVEIVTWDTIEPPLKEIFLQAVTGTKI